MPVAVRKWAQKAMYSLGIIGAVGLVAWLVGGAGAALGAVALAVVLGLVGIFIT
jgi:hypothetical protein